MPDRRRFLKTLAGVTAGGYVMGRMPFAIAAPGRRQVSIGGLPVRVIDFHAHCSFRAVEKVVRGTPLELTVSDVDILGPHRVEMIDEWGIDTQVLSINEYWWYHADEALARRVTRTFDEAMADWCDRHPGRFQGLSSVSLQHPRLAAEQLEYAVETLGLCGANVGGHVHGEVPSRSQFDPFWAKAEELGVPVFMHPEGSEYLVKEGGFEGRGDLDNIIGNPLETTVFLSRLIYDGTLDRFPGLRVCAPHAGGYLPSYPTRTEVACKVREEADCANRQPPSHYLRSQIMADTMVFDAEGLRHLVAVMGASQVFYGTDLPFNWPDTLDTVLNADFLTDAEKRAILGGNAERLLHRS